MFDKKMPAKTIVDYALSAEGQKIVAEVVAIH
jgi:ABC-type Fe3+ transport system substrate-binding protein